MIIAADNDKQHDLIIRKVLKQARKNGVKFNRDKLQYKVNQVRYVGQLISSEGVRADDQKVRAIINMPSINDKKELQRFIGMVTYLSKFVPNFSDQTDILRQLLKKTVAWHWTDDHENAVKNIKQLISKDVTLKFFDSKKLTTI
jgi:hypothetical protein